MLNDNKLQPHLSHGPTATIRERGEGPIPFPVMRWTQKVCGLAPASAPGEPIIALVTPGFLLRAIDLRQVFEAKKKTI
jgi:hypothetical protein